MLRATISSHSLTASDKDKTEYSYASTFPLSVYGLHKKLSLFYTVFLAKVEGLINKIGIKSVSKCRVVLRHAMKLYGNMEVWFPLFLTGARDGLCHVHASSAVHPEKQPQNL